MSTGAFVLSLQSAIVKIQQAKSQLVSDYSYAQQQTEDRLARLSEDPRNERLLEKIINPDTGSPYTDAQIQQAILNSQIRASENRLLELVNEGAHPVELLNEINPATGLPYTLEEVNQAIENAEVKIEVEAVEDRLYQMSLDPRNERSLEHIINPETGSPYTDGELQDAINNGRIRAEEAAIIDARNQSTIENMYPLGSLSTLYETGNNGPGTVSTGRGDSGGASYGSYQLTSQFNGVNGGRVAEFIGSSYGAAYASEFAGLRPGSQAYTDAWKDIALRDPVGFEAAQHDFIQATHYDPAVVNISNQLNFDITDRSQTLQNVLWSTSVHHGPGVPPILNAFSGVDMNQLSDEEIINMIYTEREADNANGELKYFSNNSLEVQNGVRNRFIHERQDALDALMNENAILTTT